MPTRHPFHLHPHSPALPRISYLVSRISCLVSLLVATLLLTACHPQKPIIPQTLYPAAIHTHRPTPTYYNLVTAYNRNVRRLAPLWASTDVDMHWLDRRGNRQAENGEGVLIITRPRNIAFTVGKLGQTGFWAGSNDNRYWLFDLRESIAYTGLYENLHRSCTEPLPLPVQPQAIPWLLGLMPLNPYASPSPPAVEKYFGYYLIQPPNEHVRIVIDPRNDQPIRIYWLNERGQATLVSKLQDRRPMQIAGLSDNQRPMIAHQVTLYALGSNARIKLTLHDTTDGQADNKIHPGVFNWQVLLKANHPDKLINLDRNCP